MNKPLTSAALIVALLGATHASAATASAAEAPSPVSAQSMTEDQASLTAVLRVATPGPYKAGQVIEVLTGVRNAGETFAPANVRLTLPAGAVVLAAPEGTVSGGAVTYQMSNVFPGTDQLRSVAVQLPASGSAVGFTTAVTTSLSEITPADNTVSLTVPFTVSQKPTISYLKAIPNVQTSDGALLELYVTLNTGAPAAGASVALNVPNPAVLGGRTTVRGVTGADGRWRHTLKVNEAPGKLLTVSGGSVTTTAYRGSTTSYTFKTVAEDMVAKVPARSTYRGRSSAVLVNAYDSSALSYVGVRKEGSSAYRGDLRRARLLVRVYAPGRCNVGTPLITRTLAPADTGTLRDGVGSTSVAFTPWSRGTYCTTVTSTTGSVYSVPRVTGYLTVR